MSNTNKRKPKVFSNVNLIPWDYYNTQKRNILISQKDFIGGGGILIDGDIIIGSSHNNIYYKNEFIKIGNGTDFNIPKNITESFDDLLETFKDSFSICKKVNVYLMFELHEKDKTFIEIAKILGREKIKNIYAYVNHFRIYLTNNELVLQFSLINVDKLKEYLKYSYELLFEPYISIFFTYESIKCEKDEFIEFELKHLQCNISNGHNMQNIDGFFIDDKQFFTKTEKTITKYITGPKSVIENIFLKQFVKYYENFEIICKTDPNTHIVRIFPDNDHLLRHVIKLVSNIKDQSKYRQEIIKDICIAFASLMLPPYVLLEIIDWLPNMEYEKHIVKINLIISVRKSIEKIKESKNIV